MEERGYVAEALFQRLREAGVAFELMDDPDRYPESAPFEAELALLEDHGKGVRALLRQLPALLAAFAHDFDLRLVVLERPAWRAWRAVLAWTDELGRPRFLAARLFAAEDQDLLVCGLVDAVRRGVLSEERATWLHRLWTASARPEAIARRWRREGDARLVGQALRSNHWDAVRARLPELRRALGFRLPWLAPRAPLVLFTGRESIERSHLMMRVQAQLAPLGLRMHEERPGDARRADVRVVFEAPEAMRGMPEVIALPRDAPLSALISEAAGEILRWLERQVERRYPDAVVGRNPLLSRLLQHPISRPMAQVLLGSYLGCRVRSPILMPHPYGVVIERGVEIGSRVTVLHQVTIGRKDWSAPPEEGAAMPVIEDNVFVGAGAKVLGPVRVGRGATIGANAVVTRDVPSHCTVVGANRILGSDGKRGQDPFSPLRAVEKGS